MLLSIIIPIYNVERYVARCVKSMFRQDIPFQNYEVIFVNDGTPDNSMNIIENIIKSYPNVNIINQCNQGLSMARNRGLLEAKGDYIWFVDSDDWIEDNCLGDICEMLVDGLDLLQIQYRYSYDDSSLNNAPEFTKIDTKISGCDLMLLGGIPVPAPFSIYRREFLLQHNLKFYPGILHEDSEFKPRVLYFAKSCLSLNKIVYNYYQRSHGSIMSSFKLKNCNDLLFVNNNLLKFLDSTQLSPKYKKFFYCQISLNLNTLLLGARSLKYSERKILISKLVHYKSQFLKMFFTYNIKYMIESIPFCINIRLGFWLHKFFR